MAEGWISLHRKMRDHWLYQTKEPYTEFQAWMDILLRVNHDAAKVKIGNDVFVCGRGESLNSLLTWAKDWRWNVSKVNRFFKLLEKDGMIELKNEIKTTRLTVCKYDSYQTNGNADETHVKRRRNASEMQVNTNNNDNNVNNDNKGNANALPVAGVQVPIFEEKKATVKDYQKMLYEIPAGSERAIWWTSVKKFIVENKPSFADPYVEFWNLFVTGHAPMLAKVEGATSKRSGKIKTRVQEDKFDFVRILEKLKVSNGALQSTNGWKATFDWIIDNDTNYMKVLEGQYINS